MKTLASLILFVFSISSAHAGDCEYSRDIQRDVELANVSMIKVEAGAGKLRIEGKQGLNKAVIDAKLCAPSEEHLAKMDVVSRVSGDSASFFTAIGSDDDSDNSWWGSSSSPYIDLELTVPARAMLDVEDSSGSARITDVAALDIKDSSGELKIADIGGDLNVVDSSGEIRVEKVAGDVTLKDSSGAIDVRDVDAGVLVVADSSGGIEIRNVKESVIIERDSSGSIEVDNVGGDFVVVRDSSGGIEYDDVKGKVSLPENKRDYR